MSETAPCQKCKSEISIEAERCRECGFEPRVGVLGKITAWVALMIGLTSATVAIVSLALVFDTLDVVSGLTGFATFGFVALVCFGMIHRKFQIHNEKPTTQKKDLEIGTDYGDMTESWEGGAERGEAIGDQINNSGRALIDTAPRGTWSIGVLVGCFLGLATWVLVGLELQTAFGIVMVLGTFFLGFSTLIDTKETNREHSLNFRWWAYVLLSIIPAVGFLFGVAWLARKRQKTGSAFS